jgi:hypothetical protein
MAAATVRMMKLPDDGRSAFAKVSAAVGIIALVLLFYGAPVIGWPVALGVLTGCVFGAALIVFRRV